MYITNDIKQLRKILPKAMITAELPTDKKKYLTYVCDLRHANITPEEHDSYFKPIKELFGDRLIERYSHHTGYFNLYVKEAQPINAN